MKKLMLVFAALCAGSAWCRDIRQDLWFFADFDSPTQLDGHAYLQELDGSGFVEGRYGRGYYFHRQAKNILPPMAEFLSVRTNFAVKSTGTLDYADRTLRLSAAGGFRVRPVPTGNRPGYLGPTGLTCSFYVKGERGTSVSMAARLSPVDEKAVAAATKNKTWGYPANLVTDRCDTVTHEMDGTWQRVWCVAIHDNRVSQGREATLVVKATGPVEMRQFQYELTGAYPHLKFYNPSVWTEGGTTAPVTVYGTTDKEHFAHFPDEEGTFAFWCKSSFTETTPNRFMPSWSFHRGWGECRGYQGTFFRSGTDNFKSLFHCGPRGGRTNVWRHIAGTWTKEKLVFYVDGKKTGEYPNPKLDPVAGCEGSFTVGAYGPGSGAADAIFDDFAIFRTALTAEEIASLASSDKGLMDGVSVVKATPVDFRTFYRNQRDAALRMTFASSAETDCTVRAEVGGRALPESALHLVRGETRAAIAFDPAQYRPGRYPYAYRLVAADGSVLVGDAGELEIRGRLERDSWKYMSWGGSKVVHDDFAKTVGFNLINVVQDQTPTVKRLVEQGFFVNLRNENSADWKRFSFDGERIAGEVRRRLSRYEGLHLWTSTLMNSEVYSAITAQDAKNHPKFARLAEKAIGCRPDWHFGHAPAQLPFWDPAEKAKGLKPFRGVIGPTNATLQTLSWFMDRGNPVFGVNRLTAKTVHELSPGNVAWTEPILGQGGIAEGVDAMADWLYCYGTKKLLAAQREQYGRIRGVGPGTRYVPTLAMSAFMGGLDPTKKNEAGKPQAVKMCLSADEMNIYSWIALGATRHDSLSLFGADAWEYGVSNALLYAASPTNKIDSIAEPDAPARHGAFIRGPYAPAAMLLKGLDNVRAPFAVLRPSEVEFAAGIGWEPYHYGNMVSAALMKRSDIPFDSLTDREITAETLSKYRYVLFPMAYLLTEEHAKAVAAAASSGTTFVVDRNGGFVGDLAKGTVQLKDLHYIHPSKPETVSGPITNWIQSVAGELRRNLFAQSDRDAADNGSFTFVKERSGVRYVMVVNDGRSDRKCILNTFKAGDDYRPLAAAQRIATEIAAPAGAEIFEFGTGVRRGRKFALDYGPCEARIFTVYPCPPKRLVAEISGTPAAGKVATLRVALLDAAKRPLPGRQLVRLSLKGPDGVERDESGLYPMDEGRLEIPLRFAADEQPGTLFRKWSAEATELTTGLKDDVSFRLR